MTARHAIASAALIAVIGGGTIVSARRQAAAQPGQAQPTKPPTKGVVLKGLAPVSRETLKITLPRPAEADLPNGAHLMVLEDRRAPQVIFQILVPGAGGYFDPAETPGLASITATLMREGAGSLTSLQISERLERNASMITASTGMSSRDASIFGSSLTEYFDDTLALAADILLKPSFPDEELGRYKERTRSSLIMQRSQPYFLGNELFSRVVYGDHPASRVSVTAPVLDKVTRQMLVDFHKSHYVPDQAIIAVSGDISMAAARKAIDTRLAGWKKAGAAAPVLADPAPLGTTKISFVARPNSVQTNLIVGTQSLTRTSPDYDALQVMNEILGGGPTGRLFIVLREEKGYTYGAYSFFSAMKYRGQWSASTEVRNAVSEDAFKDLMAEIAKLRDEPVTAKELEAKKRGMIASFALSLENPQGVLNNHVTRYIYQLPVDYWDRYPERISAITAEQVQQMAKKYLDPARLQIVAVGDPKLADMFRKYGTVETYDTEGKRIVGSR
jgi:predicted Zn-dependent peptidase